MITLSTERYQCLKTLLFFFIFVVILRQVVSAIYMFAHNIFITFPIINFTLLHIFSNNVFPLFLQPPPSSNSLHSILPYRSNYLIIFPSFNMSITSPSVFSHFLVIPPKLYFRTFSSLMYSFLPLYSFIYHPTNTPYHSHFCYIHFYFIPHI